MQLEQEVSDVEFVPEEPAFLNQSDNVALRCSNDFKKDLSIQHDDVDLDKEDIYIPDDADDASLLNVLNDSDNDDSRCGKKAPAVIEIPLYACIAIY